MCGIAGIVGNSGSEETLLKMQEVLTHRGPDAKGTYISRLDQCYLAHNRLSIIDLSDDANQPMHSHDDRYVIVYNGEVYNYLELRHELSKGYEFKSQSDTEVVLAAFQKWGANCMQHFIGMFAFAIWDKKEKSLFAARDRFGVKPFHYAIIEGSLFFASEIKALWQTENVKKEPNLTAWTTYWIKGLYDHADYSFWKHIQKLEAGCFFSYSEKNGLKTSRWYSLEEQSLVVDKRSREAIKEELRYLLRDTIKLRFRADVPVGICLSGGLDSSLLIALIQDVKGKDFPVHAFTFYTGDSNYDELPWALQMTKGTAIIHHKCLLKAAEIPSLTKSLSDAMDEPYGGIPTIGMKKVFEKAATAELAVLLDGNGMDEAWGGYDYYQRAEKVTYDKGPVQGSVNIHSLQHLLHFDFRQYVDQLQKPSLSDPLRLLQYRDVMLTKIPRAMRFADRNSMAHSIELREPFLDHRMVELGLRQKTEQKVHNATGKVLIREIAKELIPQGVRTAPKRPLQTPQREWIAEDLSCWIDELLLSKEHILWQWFDQQLVLDAWENYKSQRPDNSFYIWQLVNSVILLDTN